MGEGVRRARGNCRGPDAAGRVPSRRPLGSRDRGAPRGRVRRHELRGRHAGVGRGRVRVVTDHGPPVASSDPAGSDANGTLTTWPSHRSSVPTRSAGSPSRIPDVLVIGGGITGVGCTLDAASRGLRTGWSSGTTSRRGPRRSPRSWCTAAFATSSSASSGSCMRGSRNAARGAQRLASGAGAAVPDPDPAEDGLSTGGSPGGSAPPCGCTT